MLHEGNIFKLFNIISKLLQKPDSSDVNEKKEFE